MKKIIIAMMLVLPMLASAQKFGYINQQEFFAQMPEMAQVKLKMDTINAQYESQLASMNEEIQKKYQDYQAQLAPIHERMIKAIKAVGEREGYTYIFDSAAMAFISTDAVDVTPSVKKELGIK